MDDRKMIYLDDAIDVIKALWNDAPSAQHVSAMFDCEDAIRALPPAQPEIIYCKNCIYYRWEIDMCDEPYSTARNVVHEDDYCSRAERREE